MPVASSSHKDKTGDGKRHRNKRQLVAVSLSNTNNGCCQPSSTTVSLKDPFQIVSLAVRFDESMNDEDIMKIPLESGSLYNPALFAAAWEYLQQKTTPSFSNTTIRK
jgi:hypothetical protein